MGGDAPKTFNKGIVETVKDLMLGTAIDAVDDIYYSLKGAGVNWLCGKIVQSFVDGCGRKID